MRTLFCLSVMYSGFSGSCSAYVCTPGHALFAALIVYIAIWVRYLAYSLKDSLHAALSGGHSCSESTRAPASATPAQRQTGRRHKYCRNTARLVNALQTATSLSNTGKQWPLRHTQADNDIGSTAQTLPSRRVQHQLWRATTKYTIGLTRSMWPHVRSNRSRLSAGYTISRLHRAKKTHE